MAKIEIPRICGVEERAEYDVPVALPGSRERRLDVVAKAAFNNLRAYSNCCRAVLFAVQTHLRMPDDGALRATSTLAGGIGGTGETCGALLGALMAIGLALGPEAFDDLETYEEAGRAAREMVGRFSERSGGTRCHTVQETLVGWHCDRNDPEEATRWLKEGGSRACAWACGEAARDAADLILTVRSE